MWALALRVFCPLLSFWATAHAITELERILCSVYEGGVFVASAVRSVEAPSILPIGFILICGIDGPYAIPHAACTFMYTLVSGICFFMPFIMALHLRKVVLKLLCPSHVRLDLRQHFWDRSFAQVSLLLLSI